MTGFETDRFARVWGLDLFAAEGWTRRALRLAEERRELLDDCWEHSENFVKKVATGSCKLLVSKMNSWNSLWQRLRTGSFTRCKSTFYMQRTMLLKSISD